MSRSVAVALQRHLPRRRARWFTLAMLGLVLQAAPVVAAEDPAITKLAASYSQSVQPLLKQYCSECHGEERAEGDLDLTALGAFPQARLRSQAWQKILEMVDSDQMPPVDAKQMQADEKARLQQWVRQLLTIEAAAHAGDPGPVVLRRLSNVEYTYTLRDLTGVASLDPAKEFPIDSAAGEGFTNVGNALVMSPTLVTKYLDAAKQVAGHAVLLPDGIRFSPTASSRDWTDESLARIRNFYGAFTSADGGSAVNLQGIQFKTNEGGRLPVQAYLTATLEDRPALARGGDAFDRVASARGLNAKYLKTLWESLNQPAQGGALPLDALRTAWRTAKPEHAPALAQQVAQWQGSLWKFNSVGQYNQAGSPTSWLEAVSPITARQDIRFKIDAPTAGGDVVLHLSAGDAGDGATGDVVVWDRPRFAAPGRPELMLRDVRRVAHKLVAERNKHFAQAADCLKAAAEASASAETIDVAALAQKYKLQPEALAGWLAYLGMNTDSKSSPGTLLTRKAESGAGYDFVKGWVADDALSVVANSSDETVRIPGNMKAHSVAVHPAPSFSVAVGWRSPLATTVKITGLVQHAHPECGNGVAWSLQLRRGGLRQRLAEGVAQGAKEFAIGPLDSIAVREGDVVSLVIDPRDGNHSCDLTLVDLTLSDGKQEWNLARDVSPNILAGNPHADSAGAADVWQFFSNPTSGEGASIPAGSLLARWQIAAKDEQTKLAEQVQRLLQSETPPPKTSPDGALFEQLTSLSGPLMLSALQSIKVDPSGAADDVADSKYGLPAELFGKDVNGAAIDAASLCLQAPQTLEIRIPAALVAGAEFVTGGVLHDSLGKEGSVQLQASLATPAAGLIAGAPIITREGSGARMHIETALDEFRQLFPAALCYTQIVPVDEVVTLTLFYREDQQLQRLMLNDEEIKRLDRYWDELFYISQEPILLVTAFDQISEFATQDRPDVVEKLKPMKQPIRDRAAAFRQRQVAAEPAQLQAVVDFANQAYRRPLTADETGQLRSLYANLRGQELPHEEALRLTLARVLVAPGFLYRLEHAGPAAEPAPVSDWELASRLSYFLWSSQPDEELRALAAAGRLHDEEILAAQAQRMLRDPKARRLATEFACQWLHIYDFDRLDEKSETVFPTFAALRGAMYEESILFFTDMFQNDRSMLSILSAEHTYLNEQLAAHYGIPGVQGAEWRRVEGTAKFGRGGVLTHASALAKQSGASRTSPILRGNWLSEVVLGEKLPKPPKNVPPLPDIVPDGLSERQLTALHTSDAACMKCHARIDPFGFALENYDAIGRFREKDVAGKAIDAKTVTFDGSAMEGLRGLREYLLTKRKASFVRQFDKKLLGYALGRSVQLSDEPLLTELQAGLEKNDYRVGVAVDLIVRSPQFRNIRGRETLSQ